MTPPELLQKQIEALTRELHQLEERRRVDVRRIEELEKDARQRIQDDRERDAEVATLRDQVARLRHDVPPERGPY